VAIQRAYELMIIIDGDVPENDVQKVIARTDGLITDEGATIAKTDHWGRRRFAYEINHKTEGYYSVIELLAEGGAMDPVERALRIADDVVRHKLIRLPDDEAARRGLFGDAAATE